MSESKTPRTDAAKWLDGKFGETEAVVSVDFARTLESELTEARAELAKVEGELGETTKEAYSILSNLAESHAKNETLKQELATLRGKVGEAWLIEWHELYWGPCGFSAVEQAIRFRSKQDAETVLEHCHWTFKHQVSVVLHIFNEESQEQDGSK